MPAHRGRVWSLVAAAVVVGGAVLTAACDATRSSPGAAPPNVAPAQSPPTQCPSCGGPIELVPNMAGPLPAESFALHRAGKAIAAGTCMCPPTSPVCRACRLYEARPGAKWRPLPSDFGTE